MVVVSNLPFLFLDLCFAFLYVFFFCFLFLIPTSSWSWFFLLMQFILVRLDDSLSIFLLLYSSLLFSSSCLCAFLFLCWVATPHSTTATKKTSMLVMWWWYCLDDAQKCKFLSLSFSLYICILYIFLFLWKYQIFSNLDRTQLACKSTDCVCVCVFFLYFQ